jgi:plastocyanin
MQTNTPTRSVLSRITILVGVVLALALMLSACSSSGSKGGSSSATPDITIKNITFPTTTSVSAGATVTIKNDDTVMHTVTADDNKSFDVNVDPGKTATFTAPSAGTYKFHCKIHSTMHGSLTVT